MMNYHISHMFLTVATNHLNLDCLAMVLHCRSSQARSFEDHSKTSSTSENPCRLTSLEHSRPRVSLWFSFLENKTNTLTYFQILLLTSLKNKLRPQVNRLSVWLSDSQHEQRIDSKFIAILLRICRTGCARGWRAHGLASNGTLRYCQRIPSRGGGVRLARKAHSSSIFLSVGSVGCLIFPSINLTVSSVSGVSLNASSISISWFDFSSKVFE